MKKFYLLWAVISLYGYSLQAQFLMKSNSHILRSGDEHYFNIAENVGPGAAGPSVTWDFSNLQTKSALTSYMYSALTTPNSSDIPEANAVLEEYDTKFYFKVSEGVIEQYGTVTKSSITRYEKPFVKMVFPFNYGNKYSGDFYGTIEGQNNYKANFKGTYLLEADAFGTLILPNNTRYKNVIRIKTVKENCFNNSPCNCSTISYKWYSPDVRYPLLTIIQNNSSNNVTTIQTAYYSKSKDSYDDHQDGNKMFSETIEVNVYPNPYSEEFKLEYTLLADNDVRIEFYDNNGKRLYSIQKQGQKAGFYAETIGPEHIGRQLGMYHIRITAGGETISKTVIKAE